MTRSRWFLLPLLGLGLLPSSGRCAPQEPAPTFCLAYATAPASGLHVIVVPDEYEDRASFETDISTVVLSGFQAMEPWRSHRAIGVYGLWPMPAICRREALHHPTPYLVCDHDRLVQAAKGCGFKRYKVVVMSRQQFSSYAPVTRLRNSVVFLSAARSSDAEMETIRATFLHEFAHAFGLKDEWFPLIAKSRSPARMPDGPNCAPDLKTARRWWGDMAGQGEGVKRVGFFDGCAGSAAYVKPTANSIMGSVSMTLDYGPVSERYLGKVLRYCFSGDDHRREEDPAFFELYPEYLKCVGK